MIIGIRREDKNKWERRIPLIPKDLKELKDKFGIESIVQPSSIRIFKDDEFRDENVSIDEDIGSADVIFAIKEIPIPFFRKGKTYVFFSHVFKGQWYNIPMLKRMMELECNLIDYERILDEENRRLIFFGKFAGYAGMIETLYLYGQKLKLEGLRTPFEKIKQPFQYSSLAEAMENVKKIAEEIKTYGLPQKQTPIIVGFTGYGNVSKGAQEVFDLLPHKIIPVDMLTKLDDSLTMDTTNLYKIVFKEENLFKRKDNHPFNLQEYYNNPELFESIFEHNIPFLSILINCLYWSDKYPRLVTKNYLRNTHAKQPRKKLKVIGDISCDINGSIEITHKITKPDNPAFTYNFEDDSFQNGIKDNNSITVMAVDNLPCEFPKESSTEFSSVLKNFVYDIVKTNFNKEFEELELPLSIKKGLILHKGQFTKDYQYLNHYLNQEDK
jgi:alpha-aminoadipic semialdehyde synthase